MPHVYAEAGTLQRAPKIGNGDCVALVRGIGPLTTRPTFSWREGEKVLGNASIRPGTAIATFVRGRYPNKATGNHAAFFLRQGINGTWVIDQYKGKKRIESRFLPAQGKNKDGSYHDPSNNADAFSVIE